MCRQRLDARGKLPTGLDEYTSMHGWHFSKKLCDYAVSRMTKKGGKIQPYTKEQVEEILKKYNVDSTKFSEYDHVYVANMARADYYASSIEDEKHIALFVCDYLTDEDGYDGIALTRYVADCIGKGEMPCWEDLI